MDKIKRIHVRKSQGFKIIIFTVIVLAAVQVWFLYSNYKEIVIKLPEELFTSPESFPVTEFIINSSYKPPDEAATAAFENEQGLSVAESSPENNIETTETVFAEQEETDTEGSQEFVLSDIQKKMVIKLMELLETNVEYGYKVYPDTGYPSENIWISTDVISFVLKDAGYDLMELIYEDMTAHKEDYPMDIKKRKDPIKHIDFRDVFFQEQFFKRNALELDKQFIPDNRDNVIQWQPADILYFQFDPDNPYNDLGGFISSRTNDNGVPLIIMISKELGRISEVDKLQEYKIVGHFRYPNPYDEK